MASAADVNPALMAKLPLPFKSLGMSVHHDMDDLAKAATEGKPAAELQKQLGTPWLNVSPAIRHGSLKRNKRHHT